MPTKDNVRLLFPIRFFFLTFSGDNQTSTVFMSYSLARPGFETRGEAVHKRDVCIENLNHQTQQHA